MISILIVDDHPIFRKGLLQLLGEETGMFSVDEAGNGVEALNMACCCTYDLVLLDISMPGRGGLDVLKDFKSHCPKVPVLMLSMYPEDQYAVRALRLGASGYLSKVSASDDLLHAIHKILTGGKYISNSLAEKLADSLDTRSEKAPHETLTNREYQVMRQIGSGKTVKEIAEELSLSVKTISTFRTRILLKMNMRNNAELIHYTISNKLVDG